MTHMRLLGVTLLIASAGCGSRATAPPPEPTSAALLADTLPVITLYRSPCSRRCPVYSVAVTAAGLVIYRGTQDVRQLGLERSRIPPARVEALLRELEGAGYFELADRYRPSEPVCGRYVPDAPTVITSVTLRGRSKRIEHDYGCGSVPMALRVLESRIDEVLGTGRWTAR